MPEINNVIIIIGSGIMFIFAIIWTYYYWNYTGAKRIKKLAQKRLKVTKQC
jgi:hypothetical protein